VGALFGGGPKAPAPQAPVIPAPAPARDDASVQGAASSERQRLAALYGRGATLLGSAGSYAAAPDQKRTLLGVG
jgi:hypothetical protein